MRRRLGMTHPDTIPSFYHLAALTVEKKNGTG
jgi:hypothetical protein